MSSAFRYALLRSEKKRTIGIWVFGSCARAVLSCGWCRVCDQQPSPSGLSALSHALGAGLSPIHPAVRSEAKTHTVLVFRIVSSIGNFGAAYYVGWHGIARVIGFTVMQTAVLYFALILLVTGVLAAGIATEIRTYVEARLAGDYLASGKHC